MAISRFLYCLFCCRLAARSISRNWDCRQRLLIRFLQPRHSYCTDQFIEQAKRLDVCVPLFN